MEMTQLSRIAKYKSIALKRTKVNIPAPDAVAGRLRQPWQIRESIFDCWTFRSVKTSEWRQEHNLTERQLTVRLTNSQLDVLAQKQPRPLDVNSKRVDHTWHGRTKVYSDHGHSSTTPATSAVTPDSLVCLYLRKVVTNNCSHVSVQCKYSH